MSLSDDLVANYRSNHIDVRYQLIIDSIRRGMVESSYIPTKEMVATSSWRRHARIQHLNTFDQISEWLIGICSLRGTVGIFSFRPNYLSHFLLVKGNDDDIVRVPYCTHDAYWMIWNSYGHSTTTRNSTSRRNPSGMVSQSPYKYQH